jgi:hypothetical protein
MGLAVISVASGGLPVVEAGSGLAVTEVTSYGLAVTKVVGKPGLGVKFVTATGGDLTPTFTTTWNPADLSSVSLDPTKLIATATALNAGVRGTVSSGVGKYYCEYTMTVWSSSTTTAGIGLVSAALNSSWVGSVVVSKVGVIWVNGVSTGIDCGSPVQGDTLCIAFDAVNGLFWARINAGGQWNAGGAANPATGVGGINIAAISGPQYPIGLLFSSGDKITANFGASAFVGAVPSGFTAGWSA